MSNPVSAGELIGPDAPGFGHDPAMDEQDHNDSTATDLFHSSINSQPLEVYLYHAAIERQREDLDKSPIPDATWGILFKTLMGKRDKIVHPPTASDIQSESTSSPGPTEKVKGKDTPGEMSVGAPDTAAEAATAYRLLRVASWQVVFYLITTDILGFSSSPAAFSELGFGPGVLVYTFFFLCAFCSGQVLWRMYMRLDSEAYPVTCYADLGERVFGRYVRHMFNILQSLQLIFNVAILIIGNGQTLASIIEYKFCYIALNVFWALAGVIVGQVRSLRSFAWFTNVNIWLNIVVMIITMVGIGKYLPVPSQSNHKDLSEPIITSGWVPPTTVGWYDQVVGVQYAVFAYGGAMIFTEFMAEMRRPRDFWKAALCAQLFCYVMYMLFGLFCYAMQGQYSSILPSLNFDNRVLALVCNIIGLISTGVATVLYANIGIKVFYHNVLRTYFRFPPLASKRGAVVWPFLVVGYWAIAWVIGSAVPNISALVTLIGAACILQFTYTFPPLLLLAFWMQQDAIEDEPAWEPGMPIGAGRIDTWRDKSRWKRGFRKYWYAKAVLILLFLAAACLAILGIYAGVKKAIHAYATDATTAFSCRAPGQP